MADDLPELAFPDQEAFEAWLEEHHATEPGLWIRIAKKASGIPTVTAAQAIEVCLCFGWIDGQRRPRDETTFLQRYTPRARSRWSKINREKVENLDRGGAGAPGRDAPRSSGPRATGGGTPRTTRRADPGPRRPPAGARRRAAREGRVRELDSTNRYAILYRVHDAKRPETRARRIEKFVEMLARGERLH